MTNDVYKWRLVLSQNQGELSYYLHALRPSEEVDSSYIHRPGDINYADVQLLSDEDKKKILYYIKTGHVEEDKPEEKTIVAIASMVLIDRLWVPGFIPEELMRPAPFNM